MLNPIYSLPEIQFVGGSSEDLVFHLFYDREHPKPFNLYGGVADFSIINFVNKNGVPVFSKSMVIRMNEEETYYNVVAVALDPEDTVDLFGKYIYQITLKDVDGNVDIPQQGIIDIIRNINKDFTLKNNVGGSK